MKNKPIKPAFKRDPRYIHCAICGRIIDCSQAPEEREKHLKTLCHCINVNKLSWNIFTGNKASELKSILDFI